MSLQPEYGIERVVSITLNNTLADTEARESDGISNAAGTDPPAVDILVQGTVTTGTSPTAGGQLIIRAAGSVDGTIWTGGAGGIDAEITLVGNEPIISLIEVTASSDTGYNFGPVSLRSVFGELPVEFSIIVENQTGVPLNNTASNHEIIYVPLNFQDV